MSSMTFQHADVTSHMMQCVATTHVYTHYDFLKIEHAGCVLDQIKLPKTAGVP